MTPLREPPADLAGFPRRVLEPRRPLYRIHLAGREPWWFSSDAGGRFDLLPPRGTRHLAEEPLGAFLETFRGIALLARGDVDSRRISTLHVPRSVVLADFTSQRARGFGVTAAIHSGENYRLTQRWAAALDAEGFTGVRYLLSHDPSQSLKGVALFGEAGGCGWPVERTEEIGEDLIREARQRFGVLVLQAF